MKLYQKPFQYSFWTILIIILIIGIVFSNLYGKKDALLHVIANDERGYYAYLPAIFIYHDVNFGHLDSIENYYDTINHSVFNYLQNFEGKRTSKYYIGVAICEMPMFLLAHLYATHSSYAADGYSSPYLFSIFLSSFLFFTIGLIFLRKLLISFAFNDWTIVWTLLGFVFGSNLFYYVIREPGMSHVFSFALFTVFYYLVKQFRGQKKYVIGMALVMALIVLIRPINIIGIFAIPFILGTADHCRTWWNHLWRSTYIMLISILLFSSIVFLQLLWYKISVDHFYVYSYTKEVFDFSNPQIANILWSYRKGLFLYTPMYLLAMVGIISYWNKEWFRAVSGVLFFILITYIFSCWYYWYYGGSFSSRVYIDYISFFSIGLAQLITKWKGLKWVIALLILVCQIQIYQYRYYEIHWSEMNKEKYWRVFMMRNRWQSEDSTAAPKQ